MPRQTVINDRNNELTTPRRTDGDVRVEIENLGLRGWSATQVEERLLTQDEMRHRLPSLRTIQRILRELPKADDSGEWSLASADKADAPPVLEVLREVIEQTEGRIRTLTLKEADLISKLRSAAPALSPWRTYTVARTYIRHEARGDSTEELDATLAFLGGGTRRDFARWSKAVAEGWVQTPFEWFHGDALSDEQKADVLWEMFEGLPPDAQEDVMKAMDPQLASKDGNDD